jgi:Uncharacterised nucleotidyltransferase
LSSLPIKRPESLANNQLSSKSVPFGKPPDAAPPNSPVELELLLHCVRPQVSEKQLEQIQTLIEHRVDWERFLIVARHHGVMPLLYRNLRLRRPFSIPPTVHTQLDHYFHAEAERNLLLIREVNRLATLLQTSELPVAFLKGPLLGGIANGNFSLRTSADLHILVQKADIAKLKCLLLEQGYLPPAGLSRFEGGSLVLCAPECHFVQPATGLELNVHWRLLPRMRSHTSDQEDIWKRIEYSRLGNNHIPTLSPVDLLLFLCVHGTNHLWERLGWICDIAGVIDTSPAFDWAAALDRAERQGISRMVLSGLALVGELMGTELPAEISSRISADYEVNAAVAQAREWLAGDSNREIATREKIRFHVRLTDSFEDKIRYLVQLAIAPTVEDLLLLNSPRAPSFSYYLIRPLRLLGKCLLRSAKFVRAKLRAVRASE